MTHAPSHLAAMTAAAEREWRANASDDWTAIDFRRWPRGFHRSAWVIAGYIGWNPLDALDQPRRRRARSRAADTAVSHLHDCNDPTHS